MRNRKSAVDHLRWQLLFAVSGVGAVMASCSGRSQRTVSDDDGTGGSAAGHVGATGGKGGKGTGGSTGGKGGTGGSPNPTGGDGGGVFPPGGTGGSPPILGGASGTGGVGGSMGGSAGSAGDAGTPGKTCTPTTGGQEGLCEGSYVHRPTPGRCMLSDRVGEAGQGGEPGAGGGGSVIQQDCASDLDCTSGNRGYCVYEQIQGVAIYCVYACASDADCDAGYVCNCDNSYVSNVSKDPLSLGICVQASCGTDGDCDPGMMCIAPVDSACGPKRAGSFHCQTPADDCAGPDDCPPAMSVCSYSSELGRFACSGRPQCGRPFLVDGAVRQSELAGGGAWCDAELSRAPVPALDADTRRAIAAHFAQAGLMEHASIAAFARFSLQLLALGAPPELVREATQAMADETRHAELCFGLASRYAGRPVGPGPLDVTGALGAITLGDVVDLVVTEGCIGETAAALEAAWAAEEATDPFVRQVLVGIAEDEARHAALAFKLVAWALERDGTLLALVQRRVEEAIAVEDAARAAPGTRDDATLTAHGVLSEASRRAARSAALREVLPSVLAGTSRRHQRVSATTLAPTAT